MGSEMCIRDRVRTMKKRFISILVLFTLIIGMMFPVCNVSAASNPYPYQHNLTNDGHYVVNCTWYAWQLAYERTGVALPGFGNAGQWYDAAASYGYSVGQTPAANSIAVWTNGSYGHVTYVTSVSGSDIFIEEGGFDSSNYPDGIHSGWTSGIAGTIRYGSTLKGYIYLTGSPAPSQNPWIETWNPEYITETNAKIQGNVRNPNGRYISTIGCSIWDYDGNIIKVHYEAMDSSAHTYDNAHIWFDINSEVGISLQKGTLYRYELFVIQSDNQAFYGGGFDLETAGAYRITFNANGGTVGESGRDIIRGRTYGTLPTPTRNGYKFDGWYTGALGGTKISASTKFTATSNPTLYAHWTPVALPEATVTVSSTSIALGQSVILSSSVKYADSYRLLVYCGNELIADNQNVPADYVFTPSKPGRYSAYIYATNQAGEKESNKVHWSVLMSDADKKTLLHAENVSAEPGETVFVPLYLNNAAALKSLGDGSLGGVQFSLEYDKSQLTLIKFITAGLTQGYDYPDDDEYYINRIISYNSDKDKPYGNMITDDMTSDTLLGYLQFKTTDNLAFAEVKIILESICDSAQRESERTVEYSDFIAVESFSITGKTNVISGDLDNNGTVNVSDIMTLKALIMTGSWNDDALKRGDMNNDGVLTVGDMLSIKSIIMNG